MHAKSILFINIQFGFPTLAWTRNIFNFGCLYQKLFRALTSTYIHNIVT